MARGDYDIQSGEGMIVLLCSVWGTTFQEHHSVTSLLLFYFKNYWKNVFQHEVQLTPKSEMNLCSSGYLVYGDDNLFAISDLL